MTDLPKASLGSSGIAITRAGFGAWAIGGAGWEWAWGAQDDEDSIRAIRHAVNAGINWIDTAAVYGLGHSEEVVAKAIADIPQSERPLVFTKCGFLWDEADRSTAPRRLLNAERVRVEVEDSLRRLNVEQIDLYQVHWPPSDGTPVQEYWQALVDLRNEGKVRALGLSNHSVAQLEAAEAIGHVDALQPPFSAIARQAAAEIAWCAAHETGVIVYSPMQSGLLTGSFSKERAAALEAGDWRSRARDFQGERLDQNLALAEALKPIAQRHDTTVAAVAVAWTLAWPGVTGAIVGARNPAQVDGWLDAGHLELDEQDLSQIAAAIESTGAGQGPVRAE